MASMDNRVRAGVLLTLAMVVTLLFVLTHATPALSQGTSPVGVSNLDEPAAGNTSKVGYTSTFYDESLSLSFCNGYSNTGSYGFSVDENTSENTLVGTVAACEPHGDSLIYSVGGTDIAKFNEVFDLNASTGEITVKSGASIDYEGDKRSYSLTVTVTDADDSSETTVPMSITVLNVDEPGTVTLSQATPGVGSKLLATVDDPDGWVVLFGIQWSWADTVDGPFTDLDFKYISSPRKASYTPEAADEGKFLKVTLFYIDRQCRVVNNYNNQCRRMAAKTADNAVAADQSGGTSMQQSSNSPATGGPGITGTVWAGETLTATTDGIEDGDGLTGATFTYQWLVDGAEINGATDSTYIVIAADEGKPIEVRVALTDDAGNPESLTSNPFLSAPPLIIRDVPVIASNTPATGAPTITGTVRVGETLTSTTTDISDSDGLNNATFTYQWLADDADITDATGSTYALVAADEGKTVKVRITFTDDAGNDESLTSAPTATVTASNTPATGEPTITGTAQVGETLTATTDYIEDEDGLASAVFAYQWLVDGAEINGATDSTYTLFAADEGKTIKVRVTFTDDAGNDESLTSTPTATVVASNTPATGAPTITGTVRVGETLTANTTDISDSDGLNNATFTYQWLADDTDITDATGSTYTLAAADEGKTIEVRVTFTDDRGHQETLTSTATAAVASAPSPMTAAAHDVPASHDGSDFFTFELRFSETPKDGFSYKTLRDHAFTETGYDVTGARRLKAGKNLNWVITVDPSGNADVTMTLPVTTDCAAQGAICTSDDRKLFSALEITVPHNWTPTGAPTITGTVRVGETLTANTAGIADSDGLNNATFTYQWLADGARITGATGSTYALAGADEGKNIKVRLSFTDDRGHQETLTSTATAAVASAPSPLTAAAHDVPASHDGSDSFTFELRFSETPKDGFSYKTLRDSAFTETGGDVTGARRLKAGKNLNWVITVQPSGNADVTLTLPATTDCAAQGAICTAGGQALSSPLEIRVSGPGG